MTPAQQAWEGFDRLKGSRTTSTGWTDNAIELSRLLQRVCRDRYPLPDVELAADLDAAITLANDMRAGLNTLTEALSRVRADVKEAA